VFVGAAAAATSSIVEIARRTRSFTGRDTTVAPHVGADSYVVCTQSTLDGACARFGAIDIGDEEST
jgi:hypothetical protein